MFEKTKRDRKYITTGRGDFFFLSFILLLFFYGVGTVISSSQINIDINMYIHKASLIEEEYNNYHEII